MMTEFPIFLRLKGRLCVVVGGGAVGRRKALALSRAGARVRLISPHPPGPGWPPVEYRQRPYQAGDLTGAFLAFAATDDPQVNAAVASEGERGGIPVNVADNPARGDFFLPALLQRGDLAVAVSTGGRSPALAAVVRDRIAAQLGPEWATVVEIAAALRRKKLTGSPKAEYNHAILRKLLAADLAPLLSDGDFAEVDRLLTAVGGDGCTLAALGICLPKGKT